MQQGSGNYFQFGPQEPRLDEGAARRMRILARIALGWALIIVLRLFYLQVVNYDDYRKLAQSQQQRIVPIPAMRGMILDREGGSFAKSTTLRSVCVNPQLVPDLSMAAELLSGVLSIPAPELLDRMKTASAAGRGFLWIKRKISYEESERVQQLKLTGVELREEMVRSYPKDFLAAHVVGGVDHDERGNAGIEMGLEEELEGIPGVMRMHKDVTNHNYASVIETKPLPGKDITLTIDERIQFIAEKKLKEAVDGCRCKTGSIVIINPRNGDILAMASYPTYNPNEPPLPGADVSSRLNMSIAAPFEPGSVFKVVTLAAALETTNLTPESPINCMNGAMSFYGRVIHEAKRGFGVMPMRMVLSKSSNIGALQVGLQVGVKNLHEYVGRFGFGKRTGIPLPSEAPGQVFEPRKWAKMSIGSVAMGHEVTATTLQLAQACSVIANHGFLVKPRIILKRQRPGEAPEWEPVAQPVKVLRPENAALMADMMLDVVAPGGTGWPLANVPGYSVGGKTGSAQIYDHSIKQYTHKYNASFMGIAPQSDPKIVMVVTLNGSAAYGGVVAAPVFKEVATTALQILDVPRDREMPVLIAKAAAKPEVDMASMADASFPPTSPEPEAAPEIIADANAVRAPNVVGKTMRDVISATSAAGIQVESRGSGIARAQKPSPGALLQPGERLVVQFSR